MPRRSEFDFQRYLRRTLRFHHYSRKTKAVQLRIPQGHSQKELISRQRLELIRYLKARYPQAHPLQLAELMQRYHWRYGTYKLPCKAFNSNIINDRPMSNTFKQTIKTWLENEGFTRADLAEAMQPQVGESTVNTYLAPSAELTDSVKARIKTGIQALAKQKADARTPEAASEEPSASEAPDQQSPDEGTDRPGVSSSEGGPTVIHKGSHIQPLKVVFAARNDSTEGRGRAISEFVDRYSDAPFEVELRIGGRSIKIASTDDE